MNYFDILPKELLWLILTKSKKECLKLDNFKPLISKLLSGDFNPEMTLRSESHLDVQCLLGTPPTTHLKRIIRSIASECVDIFYYTDEDLVVWYRTKIFYKTKCDYVWMILNIREGAVGYELVGKPIIKRSNNWKILWASLKDDVIPILSHHGYK